MAVKEVGRPRKDLSEYPDVFFSIAAEAYRRAHTENLQDVGPIQFRLASGTSRQHAHAWVLRFNRFRRLMARERHPHWEAVADLKVTATNLASPGKGGEYVIEFTPWGLYNRALEIKGLPTEEPQITGLEPAAPMSKPAVDIFEQMIEEQVKNDQSIYTDPARTDKEEE